MNASQSAEDGMAGRKISSHPRRSLAIWILVLGLYGTPLKRSRAEDRLDFKTMYYQEDDDRMRIIAPMALFERDLSSTLTIKLEGIYNSISGASPTGAPASARMMAPTSTPQRAPPSPPAPLPPPDGGDDDDDEDDRGKFAGRMRSSAASKFRYVAGASPVPTPDPTPPPSTGGPPASGGSSTPSPVSQPVESSSGKVPLAEVEDTRIGFNLSLIKRMGHHTPTGQLAFSTESDYTSTGVALTDAVELNKKNTVLQYGGAFTHDLVDAVTMASSETKQTVDLLLGVTQLVSPMTFFTVNLTLSKATGYMSDPYKVVEMNGQLIPENRPDAKDKIVGFTSLNHFFKPADGAAELSYRWYNDTFGINASTVELAWFQKLGRLFILSPSLRYYVQNAADFYAVRFNGDPENYSSDYRISALQATGYGVKCIWTPNDRMSLDLALERYFQVGKDSVTPADAYPTANVVTAGVRIWF